MRKIITPIIVLLIAFFLVACQNDKLDTELIESKLANIYQEGDSQNSVTKDLNLVTEIEGFENLEITWTSSNTSVTIDGNKGIIKRIQFDVNVTLTAIVTLKDVEYKFTFPIVVLKQSTEDEDFDFDALFAKITLPAETTSNLNLPVTLDGITLTWVSDNAESITNLGVVTRKTEDVTVKLTVSATVEGVTESKDFTVKVLKKVAVTEVDFAAIFAKINIPVETDKDIVLPSTIDGAILSWTSDHMDALDATGKVTRQLTDVTVTLIVEASKDGQKQSKTYQIKVLKKVNAPVSSHTPIADVKELAQGTKVTVEGVVTSLMTNGNFTLQDSTGAIPIYMNDNNSLVVGRHYVIEGVMSNFNGLIQIGTPQQKPVIKQNIGEYPLPDVIDLTGYSLDYEDVVLYEAYVVSYYELEVTEKKTPNNATEVYFKNEAGETSFVRLDTRVNGSNNPLASIAVGEIISLENVTVGQYQQKAQFLFTTRSKVSVRPKDVNQPFIHGTQNHVYIIEVDTPIDFLNGVTAGNAAGDNYLDKLAVDSSNVNYEVPGEYEVTYRLSGIEGYNDIVIKVSVNVRNQPKPGDYTGYYSNLAGLNGDSLKNELSRLIRNTGSATGSTSQVKEVDKVGNTYYLIYTGNGAYGNREHVWPQSKLGSVKDDLHNLRAAQVSVNSTRSNYPFTTKPSGSNGGWEKIGSAFYPGDEHVGDVARIVLYISIRYNLDLNLVGNLDMFLRWHEQDPVNNFERTRNDRIQNIQKNRNPFIDHPELVELYFGPASKAAQKRYVFDKEVRLVDLNFDSFEFRTDRRQNYLVA